jgi:hypothetical protein
MKSAKANRNLLTKNSIPELTGLQAYNLVNALDSVPCRHVSRVYITVDGYFFSEGNNLTEMVDLDAKIPSEALLLKQGKKQKRVLLPGKYIARKQVIKEYSCEEILECKDEIIATYTEEQKALKARLKAEKGDEDLKQLLADSFQLVAKRQTKTE